MEGHPGNYWPDDLLGDHNNDNYEIDRSYQAQDTQHNPFQFSFVIILQLG